MKKFFLILVLIFTLSACRSTVELSTPEGLEDDGSVLSWTAVEDAEGYTVIIDGNEYDTDTNSFDITFLDEGAYTITVTAYKGDVMSDASSEYTLTIDTKYPDIAYRSFAKTYNIASQHNLYLHVGETLGVGILHNGDDEIDDAATYEDGFVILDKEFLQDRIAGDYTFTIETTRGLISLDLALTDNPKPHIVSSGSLTHEPGQDIVLQIEDLGGTMGPLSGSDIDSDDYHYDSPLLTIDASFIDAIKENEPDRSTVILGYTLQYEDENVIGYIFISLE